MRAVEFARCCKHAYRSRWRWWRLLWAVLTEQERKEVTPDDLPGYAWCMLTFEFPKAMEKELGRLRELAEFSL